MNSKTPENAAAVEPMVSDLPVRCDERWENGFYGQFKGHGIYIERDHPSVNWYIIVKAPDGCNAYDGWWLDSEGKPVDDAVKEALRGAMLLNR